MTRSFPSTNTGPNLGREPFGDASSPELATTATAGRTNFRTSVVNIDRPGDPSVFSDQVRAEAAELIARYPEGQARSALLPILHLVQSEQGYVTPDGIAFCADLLGLTKAQVSAVTTFYTMYKRHPTGEYLVSVCRNTLCGMLGGDEIYAALSEQLGVNHNGTTPDGKITLEHAECLAGCDYAPVVTVNYEFFDNQTVGTARNLVSQLQSGEVPTPTRGGPVCTFKQIERQIAGFFDDAALAPESAASGAPTEVGVKLAIDRGDSAPSYSTEPLPQTKTEAPRQAAAEKPAAEKPAEPAAQPPNDEEKAAPSLRKRARKAATKVGLGKGKPGEHTSEQPTSSHDAPLSTAESDEANPMRTEDEKGH